MASKALNFEMEEAEIVDLKEAASAFNMTVAEVVKEAVREYLEKMKKDPFYRPTANAPEASAEESAELLAEIEGTTDDDLTISSEKRFDV